MATVTSLTADRMLAIEAASVVDGDVVGDNLILTTKGGTQINAGSVRGPQGPQGPVGSDLAVVTAQTILETGLPNQIRAGRQFTAADFTNMGLAAPAGIWNLSDLTDSSGNGRNLLNKGAVPFDIGINGLPTTAARFKADGNQTLYIADTGANDPFRLKAGTWGCWFRCSKRGVTLYLMSKIGNAVGQYGWGLKVDNNFLTGFVSTDGNNAAQPSANTVDVADDRWHFGVCSYDGTYAKIYLDGQLEQVSNTVTGLMFQPAVPFNISGFGGDGAAGSSTPFNGWIDEAFVTPEILTEEQIRVLYCAKIPHTLGSVPSRASLTVRRRRRGAAMTLADFSTQPLRMYNFSGGSLGDEGSNNTPLTLGGTPPTCPAADGSANNAYNFYAAGGHSLLSTDAGLPAGLATRSYGCWFKIPPQASNVGLMGWGTVSTADCRLWIFGTSDNGLYCQNGGDSMSAAGFRVDGLWHHVVIVEDNAVVDGIKRRMYLDGRYVGGSAVMNPVTLVGAGRFRIGAFQDATGFLTGQVDSAFVTGYAMPGDEIRRLYHKGAQALGISPKNVGDHVEALTATDILATFDTLENQHQIDLKVAP